jgi:outer membrane scaffolding protein for murein synthesis (MipA/OmpV family)
VFATAGYSRLLGDYGRSPVVRERGQTSGAVGIEFTF